MSHLSAFIEAVQKDAQLRQRLQAAKTDDDLIERVLAEAKTLGYELDAGEIRQRLTVVQNQNAELSDAELDLVSGGGKTGYCISEDCTYSKWVDC